ncbi:hypothetical protein DB459_01880 [Bradyrhizobium sp. WD16]|nr:hypothetical protein DB459_01880 [Bradyrhizobium sp. WD16]
MRRTRMMLSMFVSAGLALGPSMALAVPSCPPGQSLKCQKKKHSGEPQYCRCVGYSWIEPGGKAEIHKRNVPTVQPHKGPGGYD